MDADPDADADLDADPGYQNDADLYPHADPDYQNDADLYLNADLDYQNDADLHPNADLDYQNDADLYPNADPEPDPRHCTRLSDPVKYLGLEVKDMIGDGEVVLQPEGGQQDAVLHGEGEAQLLFWKKKEHCLIDFRGLEWK